MRTADENEFIPHIISCSPRNVSQKNKKKFSYQKQKKNSIIMNSRYSTVRYQETQEKKRK